MPVFALSILYLIIYSITLPGAWELLIEFMKPDFSLIGTTELFAALGQAFFSVGLGGTFVIVYGGYLRTSDGIPKMAMLTSLGDVGSSVVVSLFLIPAFLVFGINMDSGPSLIFNTFPELFAAIPNGRFVGSLFLISLSLVAFLSLIAAYQVPISSLLDYGIKITRKQLFVVIGIVQAALILPSTYFPEIIGPLDMLFGSGMQMFGSFLAVVGIWWGITKTDFFKMIFTSDNKGGNKLMLFWLRWVIPITLLAVLIGYIYGNIK